MMGLNKKRVFVKNVIIEENLIMFYRKISFKSCLYFKWI